MKEKNRYLEIIVKRGGNDCIRVGIMKHKDSDKYSFINLSKMHICPCLFDSVDDALSELDVKKANGDIINYVILRDNQNRK